MSLDSDLIDRVLHLPIGERAALAQKIILSLEAQDFDADVEAAWEAEIESRLARIDRGEATPTDSLESIERVRRAIKRSK